METKTILLAISVVACFFLASGEEIIERYTCVPKAWCDFAKSHVKPNSICDGYTKDGDVYCAVNQELRSLGKRFSHVKVFGSDSDVF